ncbi:MAG: tRNA (N6-isopentenyl adenosine(37)-C2)-methylthiotransferase MiaB, partial [Deltaproteobacteria bacterium]|nr:tRNA (N6-isopentenyl adenosine(37)-C2)-methylthiotransferase MiaB [Deltaproteobacteria bacterium]
RPEGADLILLNTCAIREKAEQKVFSDLGRLKIFKARDPGVLIGVLGCVAQAEGEKILDREPAVDFVVGTRGMAELPEIIRKAEAGEKSLFLRLEGEFDPGRFREASVRQSRISAFVPIIYGCDNFCSYCVVPYVRGREWSRPVDEILREVCGLAEKGYKEIVLIGQNVNSYGKKNNINNDFCGLLHLVSEVDGVERIRFVTSHPRDLSGSVIAAMASLPAICEALHLPVQSGSDRVLGMMNRGYDRADYLGKVKRLREAIPGIALTTDIIVGFPGESESDFEETLSLIREADFDRLFAFAYSPRPGTSAVKLPDPVAEKTKSRRLAAVLDLQKKLTLRKHQALVGSSVEVLVEGANPKVDGEWTGRTRTNKIVHFSGARSAPGELLNVIIEKGLPNCLIGRAVS